MPRKMISALKELVGEEVDVEEKKGRIESVLMNPNRFAIFQFLCRSPGASPSLICAGSDFSLTTTRWHLQRLAQKGYAEVLRAGKNFAYFPKDMVQEDYMRVLAALAGKTLDVLARIIEKPGTTAADISGADADRTQSVRMSLRKLEEIGAVQLVIDGKYRRFYPSGLMRDLESANRTRLRQFRSAIIKRMERDMLEPRIQLTKNRESAIEVSVGGRRSTLYIPADIFASVLAHRREMNAKTSGVEV